MKSNPMTRISGRQAAVWLGFAGGLLLLSAGYYWGTARGGDAVDGPDSVLVSKAVEELAADTARHSAPLPEPRFKTGKVKLKDRPARRDFLGEEVRRPR